MENFRRTTIKGRKKNTRSIIEGDLVDAGALIFTKTCLDMANIKRGDGFWRLLIRMVQWFRWFPVKGNPSTITHVVGWDGHLAFGSDLCDPNGGGLNRHSVPIVSHCFMKNLDDAMQFSENEEEVFCKKNKGQIINIEELAVGDYEVIQLPDRFRKDYLNYQEKFRNDDIRYSLANAAGTVIRKSQFHHETQAKGVAYGIYAYLKQPFRGVNGGVLEVCCSSYQAKLLIAIEHKQKIEKLLMNKEFPLREKWFRNFEHLSRGFKELNRINRNFRQLEKDFQSDWSRLQQEKKKNKGSGLIDLCLDFAENKKYLINKMRRLSSNLAHRIYRLGKEIVRENYYSNFFNPVDDPIIFDLNSDCVTPAKLYDFLYRKLENEP